MRIAVPVRREGNQRAPLAQHLDDRLVRLEHVQAGEQRRGRQEQAVATDRIVDRQSVFLADDEIVKTVAGRRVHGAGASVERDVIAEDYRHVAIIKRMLEYQPFECRPFEAGNDGGVCKAGPRDQRRQQLGGDDDGLNTTRAARTRQHVVEVRVQGHGKTGRQRPRGRGPDHQTRRRQCTHLDRGAPRQIADIGHRVPHVDARAGAVFVLDLGLGQRGAAVEAPVNRLETFVDVATLVDLREGAQLLAFVTRRHRQIGVIPVTHHAKADEVSPLAIDLLGGEFTAGRAECAWIDLGVGAARRFFDLVLDRQAVAIPAGDVGRIEAIERTRLDDDVLQHLVDRVANVDRAIRVRRPVGQDERWPADRGGAQLRVDVAALPEFQPLRLAPCEIRLHREVSLRKIDGVLVIHWNSQIRPGRQQGSHGRAPRRGAFAR